MRRWGSWNGKFIHGKNEIVVFPKQGLIKEPNEKLFPTLRIFPFIKKNLLIPRLSVWESGR